MATTRTTPREHASRDPHACSSTRVHTANMSGYLIYPLTCIFSLILTRKPGYVPARGRLILCFVMRDVRVRGWGDNFWGIFVVWVQEVRISRALSSCTPIRMPGRGGCPLIRSRGRRYLPRVAALITVWATSGMPGTRIPSNDRCPSAGGELRTRRLVRWPSHCWAKSLPASPAVVLAAGPLPGVGSTPSALHGVAGDAFGGFPGPATCGARGARHQTRRTGRGWARSPCIDSPTCLMPRSARLARSVGSAVAVHAVTDDAVRVWCPPGVHQLALRSRYRRRRQRARM
jgi:hypothetical protein